MTKRITSLDELKALQKQAQSEIDLRSGQKEIRITVHMGTCGIAAGARDVLTALMAELGGASVTNVTIQQTGCAGLCDQEPMFTLTDKDGHAFGYGRLDKNRVSQIVQEHVLRGLPVNEFLIQA
jgi:(2Fe-2S) ferredoxin